MGAGAGRRLESVHWNVAGQMLGAWVLTIPMAGVFGAIAWEIANLIGANVGTVVTAVLTALAAAALFSLAQRNKVSASDLDRTHIPPEREAEGGLRKEPAPAAV
jgi:PiT family inorganic phosphate transporter